MRTITTPLKEDAEATSYYIGCLLGVPVHVWTSYDWCLLRKILDALGKNVRNNTSSKVALAVKVNREMRDNISPERTEYLAHQLHLGEVHISDIHLDKIYDNEWDDLLRWSPIPALPIPRNRQGWDNWARQQRGLMSPLRQNLQRMPPAAQKFRTAVLKNLFIKEVNCRRIEWEVHDLNLSDDPLEVRALFDPDFVVPGSGVTPCHGEESCQGEKMTGVMHSEASRPQDNGAGSYSGSFFRPGTDSDPDSDIQTRPTKRQKTRRDRDQTPAHEQDKQPPRKNPPAREQSLRGAQSKNGPPVREQSLRNAQNKQDTPARERSLRNAQSKHDLPAREQSLRNAQSKHDLPVHEQNLQNAQSQHDIPALEKNLRNAQSMHDPPVHEQTHQTQEPQNPHGKQVH